MKSNRVWFIQHPSLELSLSRSRKSSPYPSILEGLDRFRLLPVRDESSSLWQPGNAGESNRTFFVLSESPAALFIFLLFSSLFFSLLFFSSSFIFLFTFPFSFFDNLPYSITSCRSPTYMPYRQPLLQITLHFSGKDVRFFGFESRLSNCWSKVM